MKNNLNSKDIIVISILGAIILIAIGFLGDNLPEYSYGLAFGIIVFIVFMYNTYKEKAKNRYKSFLQDEEELNNKKRNFSNISKLHKVSKSDNVEYIDDQTWDDLEMNKVYEKIDYTLTTPGEQALYEILRKPIYNEKELIKRKELINSIQSNEDLKEELQRTLFKLGRQYSGDIIELLYTKGETKGYKKYVYDFLALLCLISIGSILFIKAYGVLILMFVSSINMYIHYKINKDIIAKVNSIAYLAEVLAAAKKICTLNHPVFIDIKENLEKNLKECSSIIKNSTSIGRIEGIDVLGDYINVLFLSQVRGYYSVIENIEKNKDFIREIYYMVGEVDALVAVGLFRKHLNEYIEPQLENKTDIEIDAEDLKNPLVEECISNSIHLKNSGIILTGTNMSGKSTFLRTLGINAILAQTIYTTYSKSYKSSYFNILTSISPKDDIATGKSYYLGEAESVLRILNKLNDKIPVLCIIDEIFRGTNPIERISASAEILNYIIERKAISIVATHDIDLINLVDKRYAPFYFSEEVDEKEGLKFDYKIKNGVSPTRNAIKLLRFIGYPEEITKGAEERILPLET